MYRSILKYQNICRAPSDGATGAAQQMRDQGNNSNQGGTGNNNNNNNQNGNNNGNNNNNNQGNGQGNNNQGNKDNTPKNPLEAFSQVWQPPKPTGGDGGNNGDGNKQGGNNNGGGNNNSNGNAGTDVNAYFDKQNYFDGIDMKAAETAFANRDFAGFQTVMKGMMKNLHKMSLKAADEIAKDYSNKAVDSAVNKAGSSYSIDQAYNTMFNKFESLKLPAVAPVAKTMLKNFMAQGKSPEEGAKMVNDYFLAVGATFAKPAGNPGDRQRGDGSGNGANDGAADINFDDMFAPQQ